MASSIPSKPVRIFRNRASQRRFLNGLKVNVIPPAILISAPNRRTSSTRSTRMSGTRLVHQPMVIATSPAARSSSTRNRVTHAATYSTPAMTTAGIRKTRGKKNRTTRQNKPALTSQDTAATALSPPDGFQHSGGTGRLWC